MRTHIKAVKYAILLAAFILIAVLLVYTQPQKDLVPLLQKQYGEETEIETESKTDKEVIVESLKDATTEDLKQTVMQKPNYLGEDVNKKLWSLKATKAVQNGEVSSGFTDLFDVVANTISVKDSKVDYLAEEGSFVSKENKIILSNNVLIKSKSLELETNRLEYSLDDAYAESNVPVDIKADFGQIVADTMKSYDNADKIVLTGNVRAKLY